MTKEALSNPEPYLERIFATELPGGKETSLSDNDFNRILREILCPQFNVFPSVTFEADLKKIVFHRLLQEQSGILNFLSEQKTAVINGAAGTGKTMIAVEKAQRHALAGEKVLFLCYNAQLKNYLSENYPHENIDYYTISGYACKLCDSTVPNYEKMQTQLEDMYVFGTFPYDHIVIDEGQDFGIEDVEEADVIITLKSIIEDTKPDTSSFYIFYDKLQLVQSSQVPKYIEDADCKLTLYRNCRNTENIATTSLAPITERTPKLIDGCVKGAPAKLHFCADEAAVQAKLNLLLDTLKGQGVKDVVILTCKTEATSILSGGIANGVYRNKYRFSTCRKFKGLEADAVILVDVDAETFTDNNILLYYVGTSRARLWLDIITTMDSEACTDVLQDAFEKKGHIRSPQKELAAAINAVPTR
jgi:DNA helicase IV